MNNTAVTASTNYFQLVKYFFIILFLLIWHTVLSQKDGDIANVKNPSRNLDIIHFGYQTGGLTYAGIEYEYRFSKYAGFNPGIGYLGYTCGIKFHSCPCRTGPFLSISLKDQNFGKLISVNAELGGVLIFFDKKEKLGLYGQIGAGQIIYKSDNYTGRFDNYKKNEIILVFGIGLSYYIYD